MAVAFRSASGTTDEDVNSISITKPSGTIADDYMVAAIVAATGSTEASLTAPAGWTQFYSVTVASGLVMRCFDKVAGGSEGASYSFGTSVANDMSGGICTFSGATTTAPWGDTQTSTNSTASTTHTAPSATGVADGMLLTIYGAGNSSNTTKSYTTPSGMTERVDTNTSLAYWTGLSMHTLALGADGATGTKAATCAQSVRTATVSIIVAPPSSGGAGGMFIPIILF